METIYNAHGIEIVKRDDQYFLRYDAGEIVTVINEIEISEEESREIQRKKDMEDLYEYMIQNLNERMQL